MTLLSYAQNGEDVVLFRALKDVEKGHYIDIGACDPTEFSVTKLFYDRGWTGVNVEPSKEHFARLEAERKNDLNLNVAIAARRGIFRLHHIPNTGLSTLIDDVASAALDRGFQSHSVNVPVLTLTDICRDLPFAVTHFLKIDVEGGERDVLLGADLKAFRPWIIIIEATMPLSTQRSDVGWRGILEAAEYDCVLFDGLNLYFLAREHVALREQLAAPANVHDDYVTFRQKRAEDAEATLLGHVAHLDARIAEHDAGMVRVEALRDSAAARADMLQAERDGLSVDARRLSEELLKARVALQATEGDLERDLADAHRHARLETERHANELAALHRQLERLAHFESQADRWREFVRLHTTPELLTGRGAELRELRAGLLHHARAWQADVELLQSRLGDAAARAQSLEASTSWRVTSPLRRLRQATHILRREPRRLPHLMRQRARRVLGQHIEEPTSPAVEPASAPNVEVGVRHLLAVAQRLDGELGTMTHLLDTLSFASDHEAPGASGPSYAEARLDEQLTAWILGEVTRQRRQAH